MSAHDEYLIWRKEERFESCLCFGLEDTREILSQYKDKRGLFVRRVTVDEFSREQTAEAFLSQFEDEQDEWTPERQERAACAADWRYQQRMEGVR